MKRIPLVSALFAALISISFVEWISHLIYPLPSGITSSDKEKMAEFIRSLPPAAFLWIILAWFLGTAFGVYVINKLKSDNKIKATWIVLGIIWLLSLMELMAMPGPIWYMILGLTCQFPAAFIAYKLANR